MSILSIQSHVAYGHVGNAAAVFALQRLGFEVWPVMTVQLSNHTGYRSWRGRVFEAAHIAEVAHGLEELGALADCRAVLSGYLGTAAVGDAVIGAVERAQAASPGAVYACDPVMGDRGRGLYVSEETAAFFRARAVPRARIVTPNLFELEQLTGRSVQSRDSALAAAQHLRSLGPEIALVTSLRFPDLDPDSTGVLAVTGAGAWHIATPWLELDPPVNGAGDLIAALFLGYCLRATARPERLPESAPEAASWAASATFALVEATREAGSRELQLVAAQEKIVRPERLFTAEKIG